MSRRIAKALLMFAWSAGVLVWLLYGSLVRPSAGAPSSPADSLSGRAEDYAGSESCKACHEAVFNAFDRTKHAKLPHLNSWKDKAQGCESCHGPGQAHIDAGGDVTKIISFKHQTAKQISETCLSCHSGKDDHNNFRRGEHWRNDVGCTDCHSTHDTHITVAATDSITNVSPTSSQKPGRATLAMLRTSEPQLCIKCHSEVKSQFGQPFHHKVMEGTMTCSDCHNPHGGFESKQARLAMGTDAACVKCHTDKQGPFVFEHAPLKLEGCAVCHTPHGANNPKLLKRNQVRQLCLECHSSITEELAPNAPSFHNQANVRYQNCTVCHAAIHGSNVNSFFFK